MESIIYIDLASLIASLILEAQIIKLSVDKFISNTSIRSSCCFHGQVISECNYYYSLVFRSVCLDCPKET